MASKSKSLWKADDQQAEKQKEAWRRDLVADGRRLRHDT
jgi:hypothetical protein